MTNYYREPSRPVAAPSVGARLEVTVGKRIRSLISGGAHVGRDDAKSRELAVHLRVRRTLDPQFDARVRALAGLK